MREPACPTCGARTGRGLARCPSCGSALDLEVQPLDADTATGTDVELGRRPSRWWAAGAVAGVVAFLGVGAVAAGGRAERAVDTTTTTSTSTSVTAASTTAAARITTTTTTSTIPPEPVRRTTLPVADVLDPARTSGTVLYGLAADDDELWRVDLRTGEAVVRRVDGIDGIDLLAPGDPVLLMPRTGGVVVQAGGGVATFVPDDPDAPVASLTSEPFAVFPHADPSLVWRVTDVPTGLRAEPVDLEGTLAGEPIEMTVGYPTGDDGSGRLLVGLVDVVYSVGADGSARQVASAPIVAQGAGRVVTLECAADALRCDVVSRLLADGSEAGRAGVPLRVVNGGWIWALSPSGTALAVYDQADATVQVLRFDGGPSWSFRYRGRPLDGGWWGWGTSPFRWVDDRTVCGLGGGRSLPCWVEGSTDATEVVSLDRGSFRAVALGDG